MNYNNHQIITAYLELPSEENFEKVVQEFSPMIYSICFRVLNKAELAEEASQVTFLSLIEKKAKLVPGPSMVGWLHRTAYLSSLWIRKQEGVRKKQEKNRPTKPSSQTPEEAMEKHEVQSYVDEAIHRLPSKYKGPLLMKFYENKTYKDIGVSFKMTEECIRKRVKRGLKKINEFLERKGVDVSSTALGAFFTIKLIQANTEMSILPSSYASALITEKSLSSVYNFTIIKGVNQMVLLTKLKATAIVLSASIIVGASGAAVLSGHEGFSEKSQAVVTESRDAPVADSKVSDKPKNEIISKKKKISVDQEKDKAIPHINSVVLEDPTEIKVNKKVVGFDYRKLEKTLHEKDEVKFFNLWADKSMAYSNAPKSTKASLVAIIKKYCEDLHLASSKISDSKRKVEREFYVEYGSKKTIRDKEGKWVKILKGGKTTITLKEYQAKLSKIYSDFYKSLAESKAKVREEFKSGIDNLFEKNNAVGKAVNKWFEDSRFFKGQWSRYSNKQTALEITYCLRWYAGNR